MSAVAGAYRVVIERIEQLSPTVKAFAFVAPDVPRFDFAAGQWVSLLLPIDAAENFASNPRESQWLERTSEMGSPTGTEGEPHLSRAYSIASPPRGDNRFELAVTLVPGGPGSTYMFKLKPGDALQLVGPYGFFAQKDAATRPQVFVATGTGVTPCRSIIHTLAALGFPTPTALIFGARHEADILFRAEWEAFVRANAAFTFVPTLSKPGDAWRGKSGYVQDRVREWFATERRDAVVYVCGLKKMVNDVKTILRDELGFPKEQIVTEKYD
jgi:ferredoxin-NADP reductase